MINEFRPMNHLTSLQNLICTIGNLPTSYALSLSYEEQIWWLCDFLEKKVFPAIEENTNITEETQQAFIELQNYVRDYFNNLDVQEEINNKLDDMAQSGTLTEIISAYLELNSLLIYSSVSDMKNAENLKNGSKCKTLGFYNINDGGSAEYSIEDITNEDIIDESTIISLRNNLIARLILNDEMNPEQFGCYGDGVHNDSINLQKACDSGKIIKTTKNYLVNEEIKIKTSFIMNKFSTIKADNNFLDDTVVSITKDTQRRNMEYYLNVDCNGVAEYGICVGKARFCKLNLNVVNSKNVGIDCNHYGIAGNGGNTFDCSVVGNENGTAEIGIIINNWDSVFDNIITQDVETGVYLQEGELICKYLHSWLSDRVASILWNTSCTLKNVGYRRIMIDWLYQDSVRYGVFGGCYGKIKYFEYNLNLENASNYNNEVNLYSPNSLTRLFVDIFTNIKNENSLMKYTLNNSNANEFGVLIKNGVATDINVIKDYIPFSNCNDAPQIGKFYVKYDIENLPINQGGYLICEIIESGYIQTYYSVNYKNNGNYYRRLRKNDESEWSNWFKYMPEQI